MSLLRENALMPKRRIRAVFLALAYVATCAAALAPPAAQAGPAAAAQLKPTGIPGNWKLVWGDTFAGPTLDPKRWTRGWPGWGNSVIQPTNDYELTCYDPANATLRDGKLQLVLTSRTQSCGGRTRDYAGASVVSMGRFEYTYGVAQSRVYLPGSDRTIYNWPNFWGNASSLNWPKDGENDTFEGLKGHACWHFHSDAGGPGDCTSMVSPGWHTLASDWEPGRVTYYYDGKRVGSITTGITSKPQYLAFQLTQADGVGGPTVVDQPYLIENVYVWQHAH